MAPVVTVQHLHQRVGIRDGGRLVTQHNHDLLTGFAETQDAVIQSRRGVDNEGVAGEGRGTERADQPRVVRCGQVAMVSGNDEDNDSAFSYAADAVNMMARFTMALPVEPA